MMTTETINKLLETWGKHLEPLPAKPGIYVYEDEVTFYVLGRLPRDEVFNIFAIARCDGQAVAPVDRDMALVTIERDGNVDLGLIVFLWLRLGELHRPAGITILPAQPGSSKSFVMMVGGCGIVGEGLRGGQR